MGILCYSWVNTAAPGGYWNDSRRDRVDKLNLYAEYGVTEYWIVDPNEQQFDFLINRNGRFEVQPQSNNRYASSLFAELSIDLSAFWTEVDQHAGDEPYP